MANDDKTNLYAIDGLAVRVGDSWNLRVVLTQAAPNEHRTRDLTGCAITTSITEEYNDEQDAPSNFTVALRKDREGMFNLQLPSSHRLVEGIYNYSVKVGKPNTTINETVMTGYLQVLRRVN